MVSYRMTVDTGSAGVGELEVDVTVGGRSVPVKTVDKGFRMFGVQFTPTIAVRHLVYVYFAGEQLTGKSRCLHDYSVAERARRHF